MSLNFLDSLLDTANDNPELALGASIATAATLAVTAYYTCCRSKAANAVTTTQQQIQQQPPLTEKQRQQILAQEALERNGGLKPTRRNQLS